MYLILYMYLIISNISKYLVYTLVRSMYLERLCRIVSTYHVPCISILLVVITHHLGLYYLVPIIIYMVTVIVNRVRSSLCT
jgi:hypothetical protein